MFFYVPCNVAGELRLPEVNVALGRRRHLASFVPMPETSVHEDDSVPFGQDNVRMPRQLGIMQPISEAKSMQMMTHEHLRFRVLRADATHRVTALLWRNLVHDKC